MWSMLALRWRVALTHTAHSYYFGSNKILYTVNAVRDRSVHIDNCNQRIANDARFTEGVANYFPNIFSSLINAFVAAFALIPVGWFVYVFFFTVLAISGYAVLRRVPRSIMAGFAVSQQEGVFRSNLGR
jgi:ABC-type uncharacterized transport system fused permease/ATPase subunit